jgi:hypothetical protein
VRRTADRSVHTKSFSVNTSLDGITPTFSLGGPPPGNRRTVQETHTPVHKERNRTVLTTQCPEWPEDILSIPDNASPRLRTTSRRKK